MSSFKVEGIITMIEDTALIGDKGFQKRCIRLQHGDKYPQISIFELHGEDKCQEADNFKANQTVIIHFNLNGREWKDKCFNTLKIWRIEPVANNGMPQIKNVEMPAPDADGNDLPF